MTDELKPVKCGCGGEAIAYIESMDGGFWHRIYVSCAKCGIRTPKFDTEAEAIAVWNRAMGAKDINVPNKERTAKAKVNFRDENYYFGWCECGQYQNSQYPYCPACGCRLIWGDER